MSDNDARFPSPGVSIASVVPSMTFACGVALVVLPRQTTWIFNLAIVRKVARGSIANFLPLSLVVTFRAKMAEFVDTDKNESIPFQMRLFTQKPE